MCRYGMYGPYKEKWACFECRKSFKQTSRSEVTHHMPVAPDGSRFVPCPQCKRPMHNMGLDFKAPKQTDIEQWKKVVVLFKHGFAYHSCGCCGPGRRPARLKNVPAFLQESKHMVTEGQRQQRIRARAADLKAKRKKKRQQLEARRLRTLAS